MRASPVCRSCVYDGHGDHGTTVSLEALNATHAALETTPSLLLDSPPAALAEAFAAVQQRFAAEASRDHVAVDARESGACALAAYIRGVSP